MEKFNKKVHNNEARYLSFRCLNPTKFMIYLSGYQMILNATLHMCSASENRRKSNDNKNKIERERERNSN